MSNSKALQRQEHIMTLLASNGWVSARELAANLNVSEWTIRRDLASLEQKGALKLYYGGANQANTQDNSSPLIARDSFRLSADVNLEAKRRIGWATARMIRSDERLAIGGGTTTLEVAKALKSLKFKGEIVTNSLDVALELAEETEMRLVCTGGDVQPRYHTLVGVVAERMLKRHYFDTAIIGISGISPRHGIMTNSQVDATYLELMIEHSQRTIVVADRSKFGRVCFVVLSPQVQIHYLITNEAVSAEFRDYLASLKINLIIAD